MSNGEDSKLDGQLRHYGSNVGGAERTTIVAHLRKRSSKYQADKARVIRLLADEIERGDHASTKEPIK